MRFSKKIDIPSSEPIYDSGFISPDGVPYSIGDTTHGTWIKWYWRWLQKKGFDVPEFEDDTNSIGGIVGDDLRNDLVRQGWIHVYMPNLLSVWRYDFSTENKIKKAFMNDDIIADKNHPVEIVSMSDNQTHTLDLNDLRENIFASKKFCIRESAAVIKFWFHPDTREMIKFDRWDVHFHEAPKQYYGRDEYDTIDPTKTIKNMYDAGWVRGALNHKQELDLNVGGDFGADYITKTLEVLPSEFLFVKYLVVDFNEQMDLSGEEAGSPYHGKTIPVDEGEDALSAWKNRNDLRKKVNAQTLKQVMGGGLQSYWISPEYKFFNLGDTEHSDFIYNTSPYQEKAYESLNTTNPLEAEDVISLAVKDGWTRINYWPYGQKGAWLSIQLGHNANIEKILSMIPDLPINQVMIDNISFENDGENLIDSYKHYMRRKHLVAQLTPTEDKLVAIDKALNITHQRSDLADFFIEGGSQTLSDIANQKPEPLTEEENEIKQYANIKIEDKMYIKLSSRDAVKDTINYWDKAKNKDFSKYWRKLRKTKSSAPNPIRKNEDYGMNWIERIKNREARLNSIVEADLIKTAFIRKEGDQWCVKSEKGKNMGCYDSESGAKKRLREIHYFKNK